MKFSSWLIFSVIAIPLSSCTNLNIEYQLHQSDLNWKSSTKGDYQITLYSAGKPVRVWTIYNSFVVESGESGWQFLDSHGMPIQVSGDVVVEKIN